MKKKLFVLSSFALGFSPLLVWAQTGDPATRCLNPGTGNVFDFMCKISEILAFAIPVLIALGVVYFVWGVITYVIGGDEEAKAKGREKMIYGIIGLVVIVGLWGLVKIITNTFGLQNRTDITLPTVPFGTQ
ncbi:MAG: pilin [bacterium]|nr:pilin [bacterium]